MSHCDACEKLRAELAQKDAQLALRISEIRDLRAALANHPATLSPSGDGSPKLRVAPLPSAHLPVNPHPMPTASAAPVLHPVAISKQAVEAHGEASALASRGPSHHMFASSSPSSAEKRISNVKSEPPGPRDAHAADVEQLMQREIDAVAVHGGVSPLSALESDIQGTRAALLAALAENQEEEDQTSEDD